MSVWEFCPQEDTWEIYQILKNLKNLLNYLICIINSSSWKSIYRNLERYFCKILIKNTLKILHFIRICVKMFHILIIHFNTQQWAISICKKQSIARSAIGKMDRDQDCEIGDRDRIIFSWSGSAIILICAIGFGIVIEKNLGIGIRIQSFVSRSVNTLNKRFWWNNKCNFNKYRVTFT